MKFKEKSIYGILCHEKFGIKLDEIKGENKMLILRLINGVNIYTP
jgi:hypothetical protein